MPGAQLPDELGPMAAAVRAMVSRSLGALIFRNADMATLVLESDDVVDKYRDTIFEKLMENMTQQASLVSSGLQFVLATRHLERIADHATNIAEDIIYWVRGLDVRHGRGYIVSPDPPAEQNPSETNITQNSYELHSGVNIDGDTALA
jgi:phosphate transport system protein